jgi:hypothetical protein
MAEGLDHDPSKKKTTIHHKHISVSLAGIRLFLCSLLGSLGDFASTALLSLGNRLDDTDSDGLSHVTDSEATKGWVVSESLNAHGLGRNHLDDSCVTGLDEFGGVFNGLASAAVDLLKQFSELASNVGGVAVKDRSIASADLTRVVENDDLSIEGVGTLWRVVLGVTGNVTTADFLHRDVLDVETNVVTWKTFDELFMMHLNRLDFSGDVSGGKSDDHASLDNTSLDTTNRDRANTGDLVHILERKTERLVSRTRGRVDGVNRLEKSLSGSLASFGLLLPALVPWRIGGDINHVVAVEAGDGDEWHGFGVVADLLDEVGSFFDDFIVTLLRPLGSVHLVDGDDKLLDTKSVGEKGVLASLTVFGDTSLKFTGTCSNDENSAVCLGSTSDHVLDEVTMTWGVDDGDHVARSLEFPESDIDGNTTLALGLELVENPGIFEGTLAQLGSFLLELLDGTFVNATALVDQVAGSSGLARVDVSDDDNVDMSLLFTHVDGWLKGCVEVL